MASVTIDLGSGRRAILSNDGRSRQSTEQHSAVSELMLHWPRYAGLTTGAAGYLRELGLGGFRGNPVNELGSAIEDGRLSISIDRPVVRSSAAGGQLSAPPFPRANRLTSVALVASLPVDKPISSWAQSSNVSGDALMGYLEGVVGSGSVGGAGALAGGAATLLGDAQPFDYIGSPVGDSLGSLAAVTNNPNFAAKMLGYDRKTFGQMLHVLQPANGLGPADNVIFHDSGDIEFKGVIIDNIHDVCTLTPLPLPKTRLPTRRSSSRRSRRPRIRGRPILAYSRVERSPEESLISCRLDVSVPSQGSSIFGPSKARPPYIAIDWSRTFAT